MEIPSEIFFYNQTNDDFLIKTFNSHKLKENDSESCVWLAQFYEMGKIVEKDKQKARELLEKAVELDPENSIALVELSEFYLDTSNNFDLLTTIPKIKESLERAIELGNPYAMYSLALIYYNGYGINKDYDKALQLAEKAIELGYTNSSSLSIIQNILSNRSMTGKYITEKIHQSKKIKELLQENEKLKKEIQEMKEHIRLSPDGDSYFELKKHFESLVRK
jgi:TPR repeat protein